MVRLTALEMEWLSNELAWRALAAQTIRPSPCNIPLLPFSYPPFSPGRNVSSMFIRKFTAFPDPTLISCLFGNFRTLSSLKSQLIPALQPLSSTLPIPLPPSTDGFRLYEDRNPVEGAKDVGGLVSIEDDDKGVMGRSIAALGWGRWKKVYVR